MPRIMISYRRADSAGSTGRIFDHLSAHFGAGSVFVDIDDIPVGVDFRTFIDNALKTMDFLLVVVGPDWFVVDESGKPRIFGPDDMVRVEIETAFRNGMQIVPVLVDGAAMPVRDTLPESLSGLASINAAAVSPGIDFRSHIRRLIRVLEGKSRKPDSQVREETPAANNLPLRRSSLVGRSHEVVAIEQLLSKGGLVTVTGSGGIGKTRVALQVASDLRESFAEGVWFIDLAPFHAADIIAHKISSTLGVKDSNARPILDALIEHYRESELLLIFDNCEHVIAEIASVADALSRSCSRVQMLATSREPLRVEGECVYRLPAMRAPLEGQALTASQALEFDSVALFVERAIAANADFALTNEVATTVGEICRKLDGIALAIELAAARVNVLSVAKIADRLEERFRILTDGRRDTVPRQQTMRAAIDWSYELLTKSEQLLFRRLGIFSGGCTLEAAESACAFEGIDSSDILDCLSSLSHKSLIVVDQNGIETRYRLLESMRVYALEKAESESETLIEKLAFWVAAFVEDAAARLWTSPHQISFNHIKSESDNIRQVLKWAVISKEGARIGAQIAGRLSAFWYDAGSKIEGLEWLDALVKRVDAKSDPLIAGRLWCATSQLTSGRRAVLAAEKAVALFRIAGQQKDLAEGNAALAFGLWQIGDFAASASISDSATSFYRSAGLGTTRVCAAALETQANVLRSLGKTEEARILFDEALSIFIDLGDEHGAATARGDLAELEFASGNTKRAIELVEDAALAFHRFGVASREATALVNAATYLIELGDVREARTAAGKAFRLARKTGEKQLIIVAVQDIATVAALSGESRRAARLVGYVDEWYRAEGYERDWSERRTLETLVNRLRRDLSDEEIRALRLAGSSLNDEHAVREAGELLLTQPVSDENDV